MPNLRPQRVHTPRQIHRNDVVPILILQLRHGVNGMVPPNNPRNIGRAVQAPKLLDHALDPGVDLCPLGHVDLGDGVLRVDAGEVLARFLQFIGLDVRDTDGCAALVEHLGRGEADAAGAARDSVDLALKRHCERGGRRMGLSSRGV